MSEKKTLCNICARRRALDLRVRRYRKAKRDAKRDAWIRGIDSGNVIILYEMDEFTGIHFRTNKHNQTVIGGNGGR